MFGKVNKEDIEKQNQAIDQEINDYKPEEKKEHPAANIAGNVLSIAGTIGTLLGGIAAATIAFNYIVGAFGLSALITMLLMLGVGLLFNLLGNQMITNHWIPQLTGGY